MTVYMTVLNYKWAPHGHEGLPSKTKSLKALSDPDISRQSSYVYQNRITT